MFSTKTAKLGVLHEILKDLNDYDIYAHYLGEFTVGKLYNSPFRSDDKIPSFAVFKGRNGGLMFKDHGIGLSGNVITFVKELKHITNETELEKELLRIYRTTAPLSKRNVTREYQSTAPSDIGIVRQPFTEVDIKYWGQYGISLDTLKKYQVFSIKYFLCNNIVRGIYSEEAPMYAYKVDDKFKIYRPLNTKYTKWRTNLTLDNVQGLKQLPKGHRDLLIITKSLKDVMVLHEMGYDAISPSSETTFITKETLEKLKKKYDKILLLYDRDRTGMLKARAFSHKHNLRAFFVHKKFKAKDISDAVVSSGFDVVKQWLTETLRKE